MANCFHLSVMTAEGTLLEGSAVSCRLPIEGGSVGVLANHAPMLCALRKGEASFRMEDDSEQRIRLDGGVADVRHNTVTILTENAEIKETD